jgi:ribosomal protein S13
MSILVFKKLQQFQNKTIGLGSYSVGLRLGRLGFSFKHLSQARHLFNFVWERRIDSLSSSRLIKFLQTQSLGGLNYNLNLIKQINRRIELLKFNRSWKGSRHMCFLPVRGQRTKTNARVQKARRGGRKI